MQKSFFFWPSWRCNGYRVLASSTVDRGFDPWLGLLKDDYKIAKHAALRSKSKDLIC